MNKLSVPVYDNTGHGRGPNAVTPGEISIFNPLLSKSPQCTGFPQLNFPYLGISGPPPTQDFPRSLQSFRLRRKTSFNL